MSKLGLIALLDKMISQSEIIERSGTKYVLKSFTGEKSSFKWFPLSTFLGFVYPFTYNPTERLERELAFFSKEWGFFKTPKIVEVDKENHKILREYVDGRILDTDIDANKLGKVLGEIHKEGWALGDVKLTNFLISSNDLVYVIDAEQAVSGAGTQHMAWDLYLVLLIASYTYIKSPTKFEEFLENFLFSHDSVCDCEKIYEGFNTPKLQSLLILLPPSHLLKLAKVL
ncbi:MAG: hypothetical protein QN229_02535 [Desulfurococcaceae archaeon TW002]